MIQIDRDSAVKIAVALGIDAPNSMTDPTLKVSIEHTAINMHDSERRFSTIINGNDLRKTILDVLVSWYDNDKATDPISTVDEIMVNLGFTGAYDDNGDYVPGYVDYAKDVGLISEPKDIDFSKYTEEYKKHIGTEQQQIKLAQLNDSYDVHSWHCRDDGTMVVTDIDGDTYDVRPDGSIV